MNEEALAELCRVVSLRCIKADPECEGEQPGADSASCCLSGRAAQESPAEPGKVCVRPRRCPPVRYRDVVSVLGAEVPALCGGCGGAELAGESL